MAIENTVSLAIFDPRSSIVKSIFVGNTVSSHSCPRSSIVKSVFDCRKFGVFTFAL